MATKKSATSTKKPVKKAAASTRNKTTTKVTTVKAISSKPATVTAPVATESTSFKSKLDANLVNILIAEIVGTFVLTTVALATTTDVLPLFVGLTLAILVLAVGNVSGAHVNPAVTFGLWTVRKVKTMLVPFYWGAQFIGAIMALLVANAVAGAPFSLDFGHFTNFSWSIFFVELIGAAVFLFGFVSVLNRVDIKPTGKALGIGLSLTIALLVTVSLNDTVRTQALAEYQKTAATASSQPQIPKEIYVVGAQGNASASLNPAVALASTELTDSQLGTGADAEGEKSYTRFSLETILSTLIGAAIGANLALLVAYRFRS